PSCGHAAAAFLFCRGRFRDVGVSLLSTGAASCSLSSTWSPSAPSAAIVAFADPLHVPCLIHTPAALRTRPRRCRASSVATTRGCHVSRAFWCVSKALVDRNTLLQTQQ